MKLTVPSHVVASDFDDQAGVLIDARHKRYYQLNESALLLWRGLEQGLEPLQLAGLLTATYEVTPTQAAASVQRWLQELRHSELLAFRDS